MRTPAHITFSLTTTAIAESFSDVNLFADPVLISVCVFASVLPDIDHPRSVIGKLFGPISQLISKHYGHRTITHSVLACFIVAIISGLIQYSFCPDLPIQSVVTLSYCSHVFLDMCTLMGVPLFYPFNRSACVCPGSPSYRLNTNDMTHEILVISACLLASVSMRDLFREGFWTTYNKTFSNVKHVISEHSKSEDLLKVALTVKELSDFYDYEGLLLQVSTGEIEMIERSGEIRKIDLQELQLQRISFEHSGLRAQRSRTTEQNLTLSEIDTLRSSAVLSFAIVADEEMRGFLDGRPFSDTQIYTDDFSSLQFHYLPEINSAHVESLEIVPVSSSLSAR